jgi:cytochrome P450
LNETPAALAKLRSEFIEARKDGRISDPITFKEAQTLQYFQAVIKEGLRIHPAVGQIMPRIVPEGGAQLAGRFFPAGVGEDRKGRKYLVLT